MIQTLLEEELRRVMEEQNNATPGTKEYDGLLQETERLVKLIIDDDKQGEAQLKRRHESEMDEKKIELEQTKLTLEMMKIQSEDNKAERHDQLERDRLVNEAVKLDIERDRLSFEKEESKARLENEERKLAIEEMEVRERVHYTKKQAKWGILGDVGRITASTFGNYVLIRYIGHAQQFGILDKTQLSFVPKGIK